MYKIVLSVALLAISITSAMYVTTSAAADSAKTQKPAGASDAPNVDWNQWGGSPQRNNTPVGHNIPTEWNVGKFNNKTGAWEPKTSQNILWVAQMGSKSYGNPVVAGGHVYVGTNNAAGWVKRYPGKTVDLGCLLCFDCHTGKFLWQHSSEKLTTGRVHDWEMEGLCVSPVVEDHRLWFVTNRGEVRCLDTEGYYDGKDDGPVTGELAKLLDMVKTSDTPQDKVVAIVKDLDDGKVSEGLRSTLAAAGFELPADVTVNVKDAGKSWNFTAQVGGNEREVRITLQGPRLVVSKVITPADKEEPDVIWVYDMMKELGTSQHNMCSCSVTIAGDLLFVNTSNGVDVEHNYIPAPEAPSFLAMDKNTGKVLWTDNSPGNNILHGQWSSPSYGILGGVPQVIFGGGDGWLYSFDPQGDGHGHAKLLWKFDCNPKTAFYTLGPRATRNHIIGTPVIYDGLVYVGVGEDPEHGEGVGHFWCVDPTKRGDVSAELAFNSADPSKPIPAKRIQAVVEKDGDFVRSNPNSALVWSFSKDTENADENGDGKVDVDEDARHTMHRTLGSAAIKDDILYIADFSGIFHCLDAKTGKQHWAYDMLASCWGSPLVVDGKVYIGDEDGDISIFRHSADPNVAMKIKGKEMEPFYGEVNMGSSVYSTPVVADNVLYISDREHLFAIANQEDAKK